MRPEEALQDPNILRRTATNHGLLDYDQASVGANVRYVREAKRTRLR